MIRLTAKNEIGIPFEMAEGLSCVYSGASQEEALKEAKKTTKVVVNSLKNIMLNLADDPEMIEEIKNDGDVGALVVTNTTGANGAICLFFDGILDLIHRAVGDFYALPSSIHEWLIVEKDSSRLVDFKKMVGEINDSIVEKSDLLSYDVYEYSGGKFKIAK